MGSLEARSARTIRLEEILSDLGINLPYTENDGELTLEFTIEVAGVRGAAQVFDNSLTLGLWYLPATGDFLYFEHQSNGTGRQLHQRQHR